MYNPYMQQQAYAQVRPNSYAFPAQESLMSQPYFSIKGRPVASIEEARAMSIDFDGSVFYFPDLANKRIYTKQINMDGTASLNVYELKEMPMQVEPIQIDTSMYVTREEFEKVLNDLKNSLRPAPIPAAPPAAKKELPPINF